MKKVLVTLLIIAVANAIEVEMKAQDLKTRERSLSFQEANDINTMKFTCQMGFDFYDYTIIELSKWADIIEHRDQLQKDITIIDQIVRLVGKAKHIDDAQQQKMFVQITGSLQNSLLDMTLAQLNHQWARGNLDQCIEYMRQFQKTESYDERVAMANKIEDYLQNIRYQINRNLNECSQYQQPTNMRQKIRDLQMKKRECQSNENRNDSWDNSNQQEYEQNWQYPQNKGSTQQQELPKIQANRIESQGQQPIFYDDDKVCPQGEEDDTPQNISEEQSDDYLENNIQEESEESGIELEPNPDSNKIMGEEEDLNLSNDSKKKEPREIIVEREFGPDSDHQNNYDEPEECISSEETKLEQDESVNNDSEKPQQEKDVTKPLIQQDEKPEEQKQITENNEEKKEESGEEEKEDEKDKEKEEQEKDKDEKQDQTKNKNLPLDIPPEDDEEAVEGEVVKTEGIGASSDGRIGQQQNNKQTQEQKSIKDEKEKESDKTKSENKSQDNDITKNQKQNKATQNNDDEGEEDIYEQVEVEEPDGKGGVRKVKKMVKRRVKKTKKVIGQKSGSQQSSTTSSQKSTSSQTSTSQSKQTSGSSSSTQNQKDTKVKEGDQLQQGNKGQNESQAENQQQNKATQNNDDEGEEDIYEQVEVEEPDGKGGVRKVKKMVKRRVKKTKKVIGQKSGSQQSSTTSSQKSTSSQTSTSQSKQTSGSSSSTQNQKDTQVKEGDQLQQGNKGQSESQAENQQQNKATQNNDDEGEEDIYEQVEVEEPDGKGGVRKVKKMVKRRVKKTKKVIGQKSGSQQSSTTSSQKSTSSQTSTSQSKQTSGSSSSTQNQKDTKVKEGDLLQQGNKGQGNGQTSNDAGEEDIYEEVEIVEPDGKGGFKRIKQMVKRRVKKTKKIIGQTSGSQSSSTTSSQQSTSLSKQTSGSSSSTQNQKDTQVKEGDQLQQGNKGQSESQAENQQQNKATQNNDDEGEEDIYEQVEVEEPDGKGGVRKVKKMVKRKVKKTKKVIGQKSGSQQSSTTSSQKSTSSQQSTSLSKQTSGSSSSTQNQKDTKVKEGDLLQQGNKGQGNGQTSNDAGEEDIYEEVEIVEPDGKGGFKRIKQMVKRRVKKTKKIIGQTSGSQSSSTTSSQQSTSLSKQTSGSSSSTQNQKDTKVKEGDLLQQGNKGQGNGQTSNDAGEEDIYEEVEIVEPDGKGGFKRIKQMVRKRVQITKKKTEGSGSTSSSSSSRSSSSSSSSISSTSTSSSSSSVSSSKNISGSTQKSTDQAAQSKQKVSQSVADRLTSKYSEAEQKEQGQISSSSKNQQVISGGQSRSSTQKESVSSNSQGQKSAQSQTTKQSSSSNKQSQAQGQNTSKSNKKVVKTEDGEEIWEEISVEEVTEYTIDSDGNTNIISQTSTQIPKTKSYFLNSIGDQQINLDIEQNDDNGSQISLEKAQNESFSNEDSINNQDDSNYDYLYEKDGDNQDETQQINEVQSENELDNYEQQNREITKDLLLDNEQDYIYYQIDGDQVIYYEYDPQMNAYHRVNMIDPEQKKSLIIQDSQFDDLLDSVIDEQIDQKTLPTEQITGQETQNKQDQKNQQNQQKQEDPKKSAGNISNNQEESSNQVKPNDNLGQPAKTEKQQNEQSDVQVAVDNSKLKVDQNTEQDQNKGKNEQQKGDQKKENIGNIVNDLINEEKLKIEGISVEKKQVEVKDDKEKSLKIQTLKEEFNPNEPTQYEPPKHKVNTRPKTDKVNVPVSTKYVKSSYDGEVAEQYEFADRELLQDSDEYGYGFWMRYTSNEPKVHTRKPETYYFLSRLTSNQEYKDLTYYGDRTLAVFIIENSFVFSTYDHYEKKKVKDQIVALNEDLDSMWFFISFSYSSAKKAAVGFVFGYGDNNKVLRGEIQCRHVPPQYFKLMIGGKHMSYEGLNGQFANIFYDIDAPAFLDTEAKVREIIKTISNVPQQVTNLIDLEVLTTPKLFNANTASDSVILDPQESQLIIEEYSVAAWFRWIDDLKVDSENTFQIFNLRSNEKKSQGKGILGDRSLELHYIYGGGSKSSVYFNTYTIEGNKAKGSTYLSKTVQSPNYIWHYGYMAYDNDKMKVYGALIRPGKSDEISFDPIQHKLITKLYFTLGGDDQISPFNGKIGYAGVYLGPGSYRQALNFGQQFQYGDGAMNVFQLMKPIQYKDDALEPNVVRDCVYDAENSLVDKILIHDDSKLKINGQSEYSFGMWTRWLSTMPKYLVQRGEVHNIARFGTQSYLIESIDGKLKRANTRPQTPKDQTLAVTLSREAYEFYTYSAKDEIQFTKLEGWWNYVYFGYKRFGDKGTARGYVQFGVDGEIKEVTFDILHDYILEYVEFVVGKSQAPFFNGQMTKIQCSIGPGAFLSSADNLRLFTQNTLPEKAQIHPVSRQTQQLIGTPVNEPSNQFQFDKFQGSLEYALSGWVKWSGLQKLGKVYHIITMAQKRLADLDGKNEETLKIRRSDLSYIYSTYNCKGEDCSQILNKEQQFGEYWDQWTYIYFGYSTPLKKAFGYIKYTFTDEKFLLEEINHFYLAVFSIIIGNDQEKFQGQMKTWVINIGEGSFREGGFESDENIKVHFGFISGTDHIKLQQAGQEAHHEEQVLECTANGKEVPLHVQFEQSDKLHLQGVSEYGYGFWSRFQHFANKGVLYQQPQWMGMARLTSQKDYKDFDQPGDRVLLVLMGKNVYHFSTYNVQPASNNVNGNIPYALESESEWTYIYFSYKRISQTLGHAVAFTSFGEITPGIQMDVLHNLLQNYLQLTIGHAGKYYPSFNGQITTVRFNLGPGAFIENTAGIIARIKNKDPKPDILSIPKNYEIFVGKQDAQKLKIDNPIIIEQEAREYSVQIWFRWFKTPVKPNQVIYRLSSNRCENDASKIGDKVLMLSHIGTALFSTYTLQDAVMNVPFECNIPKQQLEIWTFAYFAYSKKERKIQYYLKADAHENRGLEPILHAVTSKFWFYVGRDGILENFNSRLAQLTINFGEGSFRKENFLQLPVFIMASKLFSQEKKNNWENAGKIVLGQPQTIKFIDEPDKPIESMQEYSIGFWCRLLQAWPERLYKLPQEMQLVRLTSNEQIEVGKIAMGDRILASHVVQGHYQFSTYDLNDDAPNELRTIAYSKLEGQWNYIYMGYQRMSQLASYFVYDGKDIQQIKNQDLLHKPLGDFVILHIGGEPDIPGFQGLMSKMSVNFGVGSFFGLVEDVKKAIDNSFALDQQLTIDYIHKQKHGQQELIGKMETVTDDVGGTELRGDTWSSVGEYAISGWFKITEVKGQSANDCQILFRVTNNDKEHLNDKRIQGDRTLYASVCVDSIKLSTYTINGLKDWNEAKFLEEKIELGHNKKAWIYIYMGYNEDMQEVHALLHLFDNDKPIVFKGVQHYVPHYTGIYIAKDPFTKRFQGDLQNWVAQYGLGAFVSIQKRGYEDILPNYRAQSTNQKYMWFNKEEGVMETEKAITQVFTTEVESVDEYSIGVWTRWLISFPTTLTERQERHNIFRFSSNKEDQDKSELGDRVLTAFLTLGNYEFSTYDVLKTSNSVDGKLPYTELEGAWTYVYAAYKTGQFYGMVLFREQQKAQHIELQVQHRALTGYAKFVLGAKEFGFRGFHGWLFDPRIFLGQGSFISESQKVVDMVLKLHRKLPVQPLDAEDFKWPVQMIDTTLQDDINDKKDKFQFTFNDKPGLVEYSFGFWMQNAVLTPELTDEYRGLVRLSTNNEGSDERYIGDRTLALFTKTDEIVASTYTLKDPTFEPVSHAFKLIPYQWTFVYFGYNPGKARAYILGIKGPTEQILTVKHAIPNAFYLNLIKDQSHPLFYGKFYGFKLLFGQGSYLANPQEMIEKWPYDPKVLPPAPKQEEKVLSLNSAKIDRAQNKDHEQFHE